MVIKTRAPRWYRWQGGLIEPCYELKKKSGLGMKSYTLREARELRLLPSVTSVLSVIDKPDLDNWRVSQAIHSALTLPRQKEDFNGWMERVLPKSLMDYGSMDIVSACFLNPPGYVESEDEFAERVLADAEAQANKAAEFGTRIHDAIADHLTMDKNQLYSVDAVLVPYLQSFADWALENIEQVHSVERCVGHPSIGVAGRMDLDFTLKGVGRCIADFKTQQIKDGKARFWDDWCPQLAIYAKLTQLTDGPSPATMSIVIPSNAPGPVHTRLWTLEEQIDGENVFEHALGIWINFRGRGYDPRQ